MEQTWCRLQSMFSWFPTSFLDMGSLGFINLAQLDAGHLCHITFVSPGTCDKDATPVRACSLALLNMGA